MNTPHQTRQLPLPVKNPDAELFIAREATDACGAVSYWRAGGDVSIDALGKAWVDAGLDVKLLKKAPGPETALRRAVLELAVRQQIDSDTERRVLIRPQKEAATWAVVEEIVQKGHKPIYTPLVVVSFVNGAPLVAQSLGTYAQEQEITKTVTKNFAAQQGLYAPSDITGWLVKLAYKCGAVTLRDSGGVYFIPQDAMAFWNKAATVIETVTNQSHRVFRIPAMRNTEAMAAIIDAITVEAEQLVAAIEKEMGATGEEALGARALKTREAEAAAAAMLAKVEKYEKLVDQQLNVRERVEGLKAAIVAAAMTSESAETQG